MLLYLAAEDRSMATCWRVVEGRRPEGGVACGGEPLRAGPPGLAGGMGERGESPELLRGSG